MYLVDPPDMSADDDTVCSLCGAAGGVHPETVFRPAKVTASTRYYCSRCDRSWMVVKASDLADVRRVLGLVP